MGLHTSLCHIRRGGGPGNAESPFYNGRFYSFPGESRHPRHAEDGRPEGWFRQWDRQAIQDFNQALQDSGAFRINASLAAGLASGTLTAAQAVEEVLRSCLGEPICGRPPPASGGTRC